MSKKTILLLSLAGVAALSLAVVLVASAVGGAAFTTYNPAVDGESKDVCKNSIINCNIYGAKEYVWLNGGPDANHLKPDGYYFFTVLVPGGQPNPNDADTGGDPPDSPAYTDSPKNLSDDYDAFTNRVFRTEGGEVVEYNGTHDLDSGTPNGNGNKTRDPDGLPPLIRLFPYSDTTNPGGVYIMSICYLGETLDFPLYPVEPRDCKYDAFKVREGKMDYSFYLSGMKFSDLDAGGDKDEGEPGLAGWTITIDGTGPDGLPIDEEVVTGPDGFWEWQSPTYTFNGKDVPGDVTLTICEELQEGWTQSFPGGDGCYHITFTPTGFDEFIFLDFGNFKEELTVDKTAETSFTREHKWDITKSVDTENGYTHEGFPKIWLYVDGSGDETATWTVDVTYEGYEDYGHNVSGDITIENTGTVTAVITAVDDVLGGTSIDVDCGVTFPYGLPVGETLICTYDEDGYVTDSNIVTVTTERDDYSASADIIWGGPTTEIDKTVNIEDISDLFGTVVLGSVTAPNGATFTYDKAFTWDGYGADLCGDYLYDNTATIVETGQSADATLKVNVQCYVYESAWAEGSGEGVNAEPFCDTFSNWGWTNQIGPGTYTGWTLWAAAGQCDPSKGLDVGTVDVDYGGDGFVVVTYNLNSPYILKETHVYVDVEPFPFNPSGPTTAPGQYYNASPFGGEDVYVIAHAVVGIPDPAFGP
jgi:hypothetical protein